MIIIIKYQTRYYVEVIGKQKYITPLILFLKEINDSNLTLPETLIPFPEEKKIFEKNMNKYKLENKKDNIFERYKLNTPYKVIDWFYCGGTDWCLENWGCIGMFSLDIEISLLLFSNTKNDEIEQNFIFSFMVLGGNAYKIMIELSKKFKELTFNIIILDGIRETKAKLLNGNVIDHLTRIF